MSTSVLGTADPYNKYEIKPALIIRPVPYFRFRFISIDEILLLLFIFYFYPIKAEGYDESF